MKEFLEKQIKTLVLEKAELLEQVARMKDFAQASSDWFWESDQDLNITTITAAIKGFHFNHLSDLAVMAYTPSPNEMLKLIQSQHKFMDFVISVTDESGKVSYIQVSGKPVLDDVGDFAGYRGTGKDVTEMINLNRRVEFLASHDELTKLPNRNLFRQRLEHAISKAKRSATQVLLLFFDLDYFQKINDHLGQDAGDQLLVQAVARIQSRARATDILCRLGGDEFVMLMEGASPQDAHRIVREIINAFAIPFEIQQQSHQCTVSIGISVFPNDTRDPQSLLLFADLAMYRAKQNGRNGFEFYTADLNFIAHQWLEMEHGIRVALQERQFFMVYQPQIDYETKQLMGFEAALRWRHPERGLIPPLEFIKIAEQTDLINQVGEFVMQACCAQLRSWLDDGVDVPRISLNLSARHLKSEQLMSQLSYATSKNAIDPSAICIEITEQALLENHEQVAVNMRQLKEAGFRVALDGYGAGHSSLLYLKRWAVDEVKINQTVVNGLSTNEEDRLIVKAILLLADALNINVVGEGVENQEQATILASSGCKTMQGFFYSLPLKAAECQAWFSKKNRA